MKTLDILRTEEDLLMYSSRFGPKDGNAKYRRMEIERKIEFLESLTGKLNWTRHGELMSKLSATRLANDRLLMELVPRLNAEEIWGLFAPPPWGDNVPPSPFSMTNAREWDNFRTIDMDKEASIIESLDGLDGSSSKCRGQIDADKVAVMTAWHRIDCRTREALRRSVLSELINGYEECIRAFVKESEEGDVLVLHVQDPFHRLLLHGVCEFYNLVSSTVTRSQGTKPSKMTEIRKKQSGSNELPNIKLCKFLKWRKKGFGYSFVATSLCTL